MYLRRNLKPLDEFPELDQWQELDGKSVEINPAIETLFDGKTPVALALRRRSSNREDKSGTLSPDILLKGPITLGYSHSSGRNTLFQTRDSFYDLRDYKIIQIKKPVR